MRNKIEIVENFLSNDLCENLINYYENNKSLTKTHPVDNNKHLVEIEITEMDKFNDLFNTINNHVYNLNCKIDWINIVKWNNDCSQNLHFDTASNETVYSSIIYLNDEYLGGQTFFQDGLIVRPIKGRALFFNGMCYKHGVLPVKQGPRYTLAAWYKNG